MEDTTILKLAAGAACGVAFFFLRRRQRRSTLAALVFAAMAVSAAMLFSIADSAVATSMAAVSYVQESAELTRIEHRRMHAHLQQNEKLISEVANLLKSLSSNDPREAMTPCGDGEGRAHSNIDDFHPHKAGDHPEPTEDHQECPRASEEGAPPPPPVSGEAHAPPTWRAFAFPSDHVLLLGCSGDDFTVRIVPRQQGFEEQERRHANGDLREGCLRPEAGTLSIYKRHPSFQALFWSLPGEEQFVPVPLPPMVKELEVSPAAEEAPDAFVLSTDVVAFYWPVAGRSELHIMHRNVVGLMLVSKVEEAGKALQALYPIASSMQIN